MTVRLDFSAAAPSPWRVYGQRLDSRFLIGSAGYPSPAVLAHAITASGAQVVTVGLKRETAGDPMPQGSDAIAMLRAVCDRRRRAPAAQHRRLPQRARGGAAGADGARAVRHAVDQAGGDRRRAHAAARPVRAGRRRRAAGPAGLPGVPVLHRRPGRLPPPAGRRLRGADAVGRADRLRPGRARPGRAAHACARGCRACR